MLAILIVIVWKYFGFHMMLYIAALQGIDRSLVEAARIDGASRYELLRYVMIPLLAPTIRLSVFFAVVGLAAAVRSRHAADPGRPGRLLATRW